MVSTRGCGAVVATGFDVRATFVARSVRVTLRRAGTLSDASVNESSLSCLVDATNANPYTRAFVSASMTSTAVRDVGLAILTLTFGGAGAAAKKSSE